MLITCPKCSVQYKIPEGVHIPAGKKIQCSNCQHIFVLPETEQENKVVDETLNAPQQIEIDPVVDNEVPDDAVFAEDDVFKPDDVPQPFVPVPPAVPEEKKSVGIWMALISIMIVIALAVAGIVYKDVLFESLLAENVPSEDQKNLAVQAEPQNKISQDQTADKVAVADTYIEETPQTVMLPQIQSVRFEQRDGADLEIRIEGILKNSTDRDMMLPEKVRAIAYDSQGKILFEKEIYLTDKVLLAGRTLPFFGTYQPAPNGVQWVDVTF